jgi:cytoskeletal protein RodZ
MFGNTAVIAIAAAPKKKRGLLPLLTVLFLISYGLMTMLIVEQGKTIQSQRTLILDLFHDSSALTAMQGKAIHQKQRAQPEGQSRAQAQSKEGQAPSVQTPSTQTPSSQAAPHSQSRAGKIGKPETQAPPVPASDLLDQRRALRTI